MSSDPVHSEERPSRQNRFHWLRRILKSFLVLFLGYWTIVLIGLIPVNRDFTPAEDGIEILVISSAVHADIVLPVSTSVVNWRDKLGDFSYRSDISNASHVAIGWGDRGFFLETETWDDLKLSIAARALLWPSNSCVHVTFTDPRFYSDATSVKISKEQYEQLVAFIEQTFAGADESRFRQIEGYAYAQTDAFFEAKGHYHSLNTCNSWVGRALRSAGVKVPWFSPMPHTPTLYFPSANEPVGEATKQ